MEDKQTSLLSEFEAMNEVRRPTEGLMAAVLFKVVFPLALVVT